MTKHLNLILTSLGIVIHQILVAQITMGTINNSQSAVNGYMLLAPNSVSDVYLLDNCGYEVKKWVTSSRPGLSTYLLEDGTLLRTGRKNNPIFNQGGVGGVIEHYDWDNNLIWTYLFSDSTKTQHHDIEMLPNGNVLILATERIDQTECLQNGRDPNKLVDGELWPEMIIEVEPIGLDSGRIVWEWHSWDHLVQEFDSTKLNYGSVQQSPGKLHLNYSNTITGKADWLHCNSVDYNPYLDQIILSSRSFSEIWIIDHSTSTAEAASSQGGTMNQGGDILYRWGNPETMNLTGSRTLFTQHDARWIEPGNPDSGKIMVFNNGDTLNYSTVDILIPPTDASGQYLWGNQYFDATQVHWSYKDTSHFFGIRTSGAHQLPNGNVFICEGPTGTIFEVDAQKNMVFEYINPISVGSPLSQGTSPVNSNGVFRATKYPVDYAAFTNQSLIPSSPIELNPNTSHCQLFSNQIILHSNHTKAILFPNPTNDDLYIDQLDIQNGRKLDIFNSVGQNVYSSTHFSGHISVGILPKGMYIVTYDSRYIGKFIKH